MNIRNTFDFFLRNQIRLSRSISPLSATPKRDRLLQSEFKAFMDLFDWDSIFQYKPRSPWTVADIGARNFAFGPVIDEVFRRQDQKANIHGIEIDAYRLLWGFHTRKDYGEYYAQKMRRGWFHAMDFLKWEMPLDMAFLLNPFVSNEPLLAWGLPLSQLHPEKLFVHTHNLLRPKNGILVLSSPSLEEFEIAQELSKKAGFKAGQSVLWHPPKNSIQQKSRHGLALYTD